MFKNKINTITLELYFIRPNNSIRGSKMAIIQLTLGLRSLLNNVTIGILATQKTPMFIGTVNHNVLYFMGRQYRKVSVFLSCWWPFVHRLYKLGNEIYIPIKWTNFNWSLNLYRWTFGKPRSTPFDVVGRSLPNWILITWNTIYRYCSGIQQEFGLIWVLQPVWFF